MKSPHGFLAWLHGRWGAMPRLQKALAVLAAAGLLVTVIYFTQLLAKPGMAPLFTGLEPKQAGKIAEELKVMKVPYRLSDQGKTIEVPSDRVYELRVELASKGILYEAGAGFELFDQQKFGITDFEQQVGYQRALQEELRRTIVQMEGMEQARVHLVMPKESLFLDNQVTPSASIALKLKPLTELKPEQVQGIVDLVMGSVQGLQPENIHIIDLAGNVLTDKLAFKDEQAKRMQLTMDQYQVRRTYEKELEDRIQKMLAKVLGPSKAIAMVTADLDFDQRQSTATSYQPGQILSQQTLKEQGTGTGSAGGSPGTDTSQPGSAIPGLVSGGNSTYSKEQATTNYQVGTQQETLVGSPGNLRRLSVSVVLDGIYGAPEIQQVTEMVRASVGAQDERGDQVNVSSLPFDTAYLEEMRRAMEGVKKPLLGEQTKQWLILAGAGVILLGLILLGLMFLIKWWQQRRLKEKEIREIQEVQKILSEAVPPDEKILAVEVPQMPKRIDELRKLAKEDPSGVAEIIKLLLKE